MLETVLKHFTEARICLLVDDIGTPPRAAWVGPASRVDASWVNRLLKLSGGHLHVTLLPERVSNFMLAPMASARRGQAANLAQTFSLLESVEARHGVTTGISAADRAQTIRTLADPQPHPRIIIRPGHIFPVAVREGGVLVKSTLPEGASDITSLAGYGPVAVLSEALSADGSYLEESEYHRLCTHEAIPLIRLSDVITHRLRNERLVERLASASLPTRTGGLLTTHLYRSTIHGGEHMALVKGEISGDIPVLTRVQTEFTFSDVFGGNNPPSRARLHQALHIIEQEGKGVVIYLRRSEPGTLSEQVRSWSKEFRQKGAYTMREYGLGAQILRDLGVRKVELLTDSQKQIPGLGTFGLEISGYRSL